MASRTIFRTVAQMAMNQPKRAGCCGISTLVRNAPSSARAASTGLKEPAPVFNTAWLAGTALFGGAFYLGMDGLFKSRQGHEYYPMGETQEVDTVEQLNKIRQDRFNNGVMEACKAAAIWGTLSGLVLFGLRSVEEKTFRSTALARMGTPRLVYLTTGMACIGFALRGEQQLTQVAREPLRVKQQD
mmetsp:Transcript_21805/g.50605  ORF Transcript_21805/g.50605 Transcript_21805/m.50605 type:complete len:186 (+) Transcript_21805:114-671(+)|eukprot:CAMPEP_0114126406 /NCGR_PEP_ID=MMETSP0043_2-20121206/9815_1 /TAXON_ID=464988 /ORGANISM="Hemiselmis andersenii, Strain CCMP644" /LENGTH=185 /DNA_ID=CAMNT_0001219393 /DNA_START=86 /DNA_END=643 /DNA_ORIENTATION=-